MKTILIFFLTAVINTQLIGQITLIGLDYNSEGTEDYPPENTWLNTAQELHSQNIKIQLAYVNGNLSHVDYLNDQGLIYKTEYFQNRRIIQRIVKSFSKENTMLKRVEYAFNPYDSLITAHHYNEQGQEIKREFSNHIRKNFTWKYEYNEDQKIISGKGYIDEKLQLFSKYFFNQNGKLIEDHEFENETDQKPLITYYKYNENNTLTEIFIPKQDEYITSRDLKILLKHNEKKFLTEQSSLHQDGNIYTDYKWQYNEKGKIISQTKSKYYSSYKDNANFPNGKYELYADFTQTYHYENNLLKYVLDETTQTFVYAFEHLKSVDGFNPKNHLHYEKTILKGSEKNSNRIEENQLTYKKGDLVLGLWSDNYWYPANIAYIENDKIKILFKDGDQGNVTREKIKSLNQKFLNQEVEIKLNALWTKAIITNIDESDFEYKAIESNQMGRLSYKYLRIKN